MTVSDLYGPIVTNAQVRNAVLTTLQTWMPYYLAELERQTDLPTAALQPPAGWEVLPEYAQTTDTQLPGVAVVVAGLAGEPDGSEPLEYAATWLTSVFVTVEARNFAETADLLGYYTAAVRAALTQHGELGGFASNVVWRDEVYNQLRVPNRSVQAGGVVFAVTVDDVVRRTGPQDVPAGGPFAVPVVHTAHTIKVSETLLAHPAN